MISASKSCFLWIQTRFHSRLRRDWSRFFIVLNVQKENKVDRICPLNFPKKYRIKIGSKQNFEEGIYKQSSLIYGCEIEKKLQEVRNLGFWLKIWLCKQQLLLWVTPPMALLSQTVLYFLILKSCITIKL